MSFYVFLEVCLFTSFLKYVSFPSHPSFSAVFLLVHLRYEDSLEHQTLILATNLPIDEGDLRGSVMDL